MHLGRTSIVACNSNKQADDLTARMSRRFPMMPILRLMRANFDPPRALAALPNVTLASAAVPGNPVVVTTTAKLIDTSTPPSADVLMFDEAYQLTFGEFMLMRGLAPRSLTIGDPGQIDPIVQIPIRHWAADPNGPHIPAPRVVLARNEARRFRLPLSRRLPTDSADIVRTAFYPDMAFTGLAAPATRRLELRAAGVTRTDGILDAALNSGSLSSVTLPPRLTPYIDVELVDLIVSLVRRMLLSDPIVHDDGRTATLQPSDIGVVVSRVEQVAAVVQALGSLAHSVLVETANRFQGLERKVVLAAHPLSGTLHPTEFNLNPGRMCVSLSRHRVACILLTRTGIPATLTGYMPDNDRFLGQQGDPSFAGWRAHGAVWHRLEAESKIIEA